MTIQKLKEAVDEYYSLFGPDAQVTLETPDCRLGNIRLGLSTPRSFILEAPITNDPEQEKEEIQKQLITAINNTLTPQHIHSILLKIDTRYPLENIARDIRSHLDEDFFLKLINDHASESR